MEFTDGNEGASAEEQVLSCSSTKTPFLPSLGAGSCEGDTLLFRLSGATCLTGHTPEGN